MLAYIFVALAVAVHLTLLPHPWMFTPVVGSLLFFGARGPRRQLWIPFVLLAVSDVLLNKFVYHYPFLWDQLITWAWYAAILWLGTNLRENTKPLRIIGAALASSLSFFLLSNFGVWAAGTMYPHTWAGLMTCYTLGLPYFRPAVEGDLFFTAAMFATPGLLYVLGIYRERGDHQASA
ncbi:MAG: DUF6580 family putative transport protein [Terriglobales bacterium]|jgi:hypothetical protein